MKKFLLTLIALNSLLYGENIYATFTVAAAKDAKLAFVAGGIVSKLYVSVGSVVHKDELLASLQNDDIKAILASAKTTLKFAKRSLNRQQKVKKLIDEGTFDKVLSNYEKAKNAVAYQEALYKKTYLKAPFDGVIYDKDIEIGDAVSGMMIKTVFKIQSQHERKLIVEFDQKYHNAVHVGDLYYYTIDGDSKKYSAPITKIYPYANFHNRKIRAEVATKDIMVGLFGDGTIVTGKE